MNSPKLVKISKNISVGLDQPLLLIAGPCQIESLDHCLKIAEFLKRLALKYNLNLVFKSSFDKANRTSIKGQRGIGMQEGLRVLEKIRESLDLAVLTDLHSAEQVTAVAQVVDVLQIPAFLCRQTDLLIAAGNSNKAIHVKKGQFLDPHDMQHVAAKIASTGNHNILLCERGSCFGYRDLVVDMRALQVMQETTYPVVFDATHSVQSMGGAGGASSGQRQYVLPLMRAALAVGVQGIFLECHDNPDLAPSDGPSMLRLDQMEAALQQATALHQLSLSFNQ